MKMKVLPLDPWRRAACLFSLAAFSTFAVNLAFTLWATRWQGETVEDGIGVVFEGGCSDIKRLNTAVHVVINILSTVLLAGSNYCMQCTIAPTRPEIDRAHARRKWLDIGVPSIRNLGRIKWEKKALWLLLSLSSFPLHLLYNSVIFASTSVNSYRVFIVKEQFILGENRALVPNRSEPLDQMYVGFKTGILKSIDASECIRTYGTPFQSSRGSLLLVTANNDIPDDTRAGSSMLSNMWPYFLYQYGYNATLEMGPFDQLEQAFDWFCSYEDERICEDLIPKVLEAPQDWKPWRRTVTQFYSQETEEHCRLLFSVTICWIVTGMNLLKGILMLFVAFRGGDSPILTIGDAVASFLEIPDNFTKGMSLNPKKPFTKNDWSQAPQQFHVQPQRKFSAGSRGRWTICTLLYLVSVAVCLSLLLRGLMVMEGNRGITQFGFGTVHSKTVMNIGLLGQGSKYLLLNALLANTPQVIMSLLYFNYNALYTILCMATEWDRFGGEYKGLRVSSTSRGAQRGTYFLQLPYRYSLPLLVFSGALHWLISQSIFLVNLEVYEPSPANILSRVRAADNGPRDDYRGDANLTSCKWSPLGIVCTVVVALVMIAFLLASGWRRFKNGIMPVSGSCSAAISAACHPDTDEAEAWEKPLRWGVVAEPCDEPRHCSFSSLPVETPIKGQWYA